MSAGDDAGRSFGRSARMSSPFAVTKPESMALIALRGSSSAGEDEVGEAPGTEAGVECSSMNV